MSYQFIHIEAYGREGAVQKKTNKKTGEVTEHKTRSMRDISNEAERKPEDCHHVRNPEPPKNLYGCTPGEAVDLAEEWAKTATDAKGRKYRKDGLCMIAGVISLPREQEDDFDEFAVESIEWLQKKWGDRLKSVVAHNDEAHPHIHFYVVPKVGEKFEDIHQGYKASREAKRAGEKKGPQNLAYIGAMRELQDEFSKEVAMGFGLTRIGPARRRLTRAEHQAEKQQAAFFADLKKVAKVYAKKGYKAGLEKAQKEALEIIEKAHAQARKVGQKVSGMVVGALGSWHKPTRQAEEGRLRAEARAEKAKKQAEKVRAEEQEKANARVRAVATDLQTEKAKTKGLEKELDLAEKQTEQLANRLAVYEPHTAKDLKHR